MIKYWKKVLLFRRGYQLATYTSGFTRLLLIIAFFSQLEPSTTRSQLVASDSICYVDSFIQLISNNSNLSRKDLTLGVNSNNALGQELGGSSVKNRISSIFVVDKNERRKLQHVLLNKDECQEKSMTSKIVWVKLTANLVVDILAYTKKLGNSFLKTQLNNNSFILH